MLRPLDGKIFINFQMQRGRMMNAFRNLQNLPRIIQEMRENIY